jgi:hypothetical protein
MHRTFSPVTSTYPNLPACTTGNEDGIMWESAQYPEPGLPAMIAHADILRLALNDRTHVDTFLARRAASNGTTREQLWDQMINAPNDSPELKALVFAALLQVARQDAKLASNAAQSVSFFQTYVQRRRTYVAQDARAMYDAYLGFNAYKQWKGTKAVMMAGGPMGFISAGTGAVITSPSAGLGSTVGVPPDDYVNKAYAAAAPDARGQAFVGALNDLAGMSYEATGDSSTAALDPSTALQLGLSITSTALSMHDLLDGLGVAKGIAALSGRVRMGVDVGMGLAGNVLDAVGAIMTVYAQQEAAAQYAKLVEEANRPVNIKQTLDSGSMDDKNSLIMWWALATSPYKPTSTFGQTALTNAEVCAAYSTQCATIRNIVTAARPVTSPTSPPPPRPSRPTDGVR